MSRFSTGRTAAYGWTANAIFSVQHHPEASPGPQDSFYLFERFAAAMRNRKAETV